MPGASAHAIGFDVDGVLMDSEHWWDQIRRQITAEHGGNWQDGATEAMLGMSTPEWSEYLATQLGVRLPPEQVARTVIDEMARRFADGPPVWRIWLRCWTASRLPGDRPHAGPDSPGDGSHPVDQ